jgi:hypothetical protein
MQNLLDKISTEARDALKSGNLDALVKCLRWIRDVADTTSAQYEVSKEKGKNNVKLIEHLDLTATQDLINALGRRNKGLVVLELRYTEVGREAMYVSYRNGYTQSYGLSMRGVDYLESMGGGSADDDLTEGEEP